LAPEERFCGNCGAPRPEQVQEPEPRQSSHAERQIDARFKKVEEEYRALKGQVTSGRLTNSQFETALEKLAIQDSEGHYWMIGAFTGQWYRSEGQEWVRQGPPDQTGKALPVTRTYSSPIATGPEIPWKWIAIISAALVGLGACGLIAFGLIALGSATAGPTVAAIASAPATPTMPLAGTAVSASPPRPTGTLVSTTAKPPTSATEPVRPPTPMIPSPTSTRPTAPVISAATDRSQRIAFVGHSDGEIYSMNVDGSDRRRLTSQPGPNTDPAWSPDGQQIAFASLGNAGTGLYAMNRDGSNLRMIRSFGKEEFGGAPLVARPSWSPDGKRIAFTLGIIEISALMTGPSFIYVVNADGTGLQRVAEGWDPTWSPDGQRLAFASGKSSRGIYTTRPDGTNETQLTSESGTFSSLAW
jgi:TolB protein